MTKEIKFFIETLEKLTGKKVILEANVRWAPIVLDYVTKNPGQTNKEILNGLGIPLSDSQKTNIGYNFSAAQGSALVNLRKLVKSGVLSREKKGREFTYSLASTTSISTSKPEVKTKKQKKGLTFEQVFELINQKWPYRNREGNKFEGQKGDYYLDFNTDDRGPRTDHHGPPDGSGWMTDEQVRQVSRPYIDKWRPRLDQLEKELKQAGVDVKTYVDYGEKGHVALQLKIETPLKESNLQETDSKYDNMKHYPESHLHPLVQQSLKYQYERLKRLFPGLDNFDVKQDPDKIIRMHYTYKGKPYKTRVDLNGDTGERAFNAIKRNIAPKPKSGRLINTSNFRF